VAEGLTVNGVPLDTYAYLVTDVSGLMVAPAKRGENVVVPGRHGRIRAVNKKFDSVDVVLPMWVNGALPDGSIPTGSSDRIEWFRRRDELLRVLHADPLIIEFTRPDGHAVNTVAEVVDSLAFERMAMQPEAQLNVALTLNEPFWQDADSVSQTVTGATGATQALTEFEGATAPMSDLLITVFGPCNNPMLAHGDRWVKYNGVIASGRQLVLNTEIWKPTPGTGTIWSPDLRLVEYGEAGAGWFELDPTTSPFNVVFSHTGGGSATATIAGRRKYLVP
jgi:hypothetical protein